jgi:DNA-directed RNA polymerase specialized sigma24 family protein
VQGPNMPPDAFCDMLPDALWASPHIAARKVFEQERKRPEDVAWRFLRRKARQLPALSERILQDIDDWQQEASWKFFVVLRERFEAGRVDGSLAYAARSALNHLRDCWKTNEAHLPYLPRREDPKKRTTAVVASDSLSLRVSGSPEPLLQLLEAENMALVQEALEVLRRQRQSLYQLANLHLVEGQSGAEIARSRDLDERAVQRAIRRAKDWLRSHLLSKYRTNFEEFLSAQQPTVV